jgi:hypothetical protein
MVKPIITTNSMMIMTIGSAVISSVIGRCVISQFLGTIGGQRKKGADFSTPFKS